jgi:DNA helicase-2/ATP-dependent DNA helicase PcrA
MNRVTLSVAGGRKTQSIIDECCGGGSQTRRLALTYTLTGQTELERRLEQSCAPGSAPEVLGWFAFLLRHCVRPYLPLMFDGVRLAGLNFDGTPGRYATGETQYFDSGGRVFRRSLSKLAFKIVGASNGAVLDRISRIYDEIYVDEVQDLTGYDLHLLSALFDVRTHIHVVGDLRQSVFSTNAQDPALRQFRGVKMLDWFNSQAADGKLDISHASESWRCNQQIASFSDTLFPDEAGFEATVSRQTATTDHDGVFVLRRSDLETYVKRFDPLCLRASKATAPDLDMTFRNFGQVKGLSTDRVLIFPTVPIVEFLTRGKALKPQSACGLYVAVTRARHSVAFVVDSPHTTSLPVWTE